MISANSVLLVTLLSATPSVELLEYTAPWCGACQTMQPVVARLQANGVPVRQIQVDKQPRLAADAGVQSIPCFLAVSNGQVVGRIDGTASYEQLYALANPAPSRGPQIARPPSSVVRGQNEMPAGAVPAADRAVHQAASRAPMPRPDQSGNRSADASKIDATVARCLSATVRLRVEDARGTSLGTGTIIDVHNDEALVLTCGHIFRDSAGRGRITCDLFAPRGPQQVPGKLVSYDLRRDVGLVSLRPGVSVEPVRVGGTGCRPCQHAPVFSIGCNHGEQATVIRNQILAVNRYHGPANLVVGGRPVDGRSGGGLFDSQGRLIGVCNAADQKEDEGLYAALGPIHAELDTAGLAFIYRQQTPSLAQASPAGNHPAPTDRPASASAPWNGGPTQPVAPGLPVSSPCTPQPELEQAAAWPGEPGTGASGASCSRDTEVICIVRSRRGDAGQGKAFVLDHPSPQLLNQLSQELGRRGPHVPTQMYQQQPSTADGTVRLSSCGGWKNDAGSAIRP